MSRLDDKLDLVHAIGIWNSLKRKPGQGVNLSIGIHREAYLPPAICEAVEIALHKAQNRV